MLEQRQPETMTWSSDADWRALEEQLGSPEDATARSSSVFSAAVAQVTSAAGLQSFIADFKTAVLAREELPVILRAYNHARAHEAREIIQLDRSIENSFPSEALANASQRVGRNQLRKMRALKSERVVTKYWEAVHSKKAAGWHTIVFGVVLAVYSIPLRQGLQHYTQQTIRGFLDAGAASLKLRLPEINALEESLLADTPALIETALAAVNHGGIRIV